MSELLCQMCELETVPEPIWREEGGMCVDCSNGYYEHDHPDCSWMCIAVELPKELRAKKLKLI